MAVEAPISKYKKTNIKIFIVILLAGGAWFFYDGYYNQGFIDKHTTEEGEPDDTLVFNRVFWPVGLIGAALLGGYLWAVSDKKIIADEQALDIDGNQKISYDSIEKINKTDFESKGVFTLTYTDESGKSVTKKLSSRRYDNLDEVLEHIVSKIS
jgi:inorganic pyrophosphatase